MMRVRLNRAHLDPKYEGIMELEVPVSRIAYVQQDEGNPEMGERGVPEIILVYPDKIPTELEEPELYNIPHELDVKQLMQERYSAGDKVLFSTQPKKAEVWLKYELATAILITKEADDNFRKENPDLIERVETFYAELCE